MLSPGRTPKQLSLVNPPRNKIGSFTLLISDLFTFLFLEYSFLLIYHMYNNLQGLLAVFNCTLFLYTYQATMCCITLKNFIHPVYEDVLFSLFPMHNFNSSYIFLNASLSTISFVALFFPNLLFWCEAYLLQRLLAPIIIC